MKSPFFVPMLSTLALSLVLPFPIAADEPGTLDGGKLELAWFGPGAEFRQVDEIDYLWMSEGFDLAGKSVSFADWPQPEFRGPRAGERDEKDHTLAKRMNNDMADLFRDVFTKGYGKRLTIAEGEGDVRIEGRIVDASTGSTAAKIFVGFGAGSGNVTIDLRFVDPTSGRILGGLHHRVVSGTTMSTSDGKFVGWLDDLADLLQDKSLTKLYAKGRKVRE